MNSCKICHSPTVKLFSKTILKKYPADYFKCSHCNFVQTSDPVWLKEAYASAITSLDIGLIDRNLYLKARVCEMIDTFFPESKVMIDYAGGYGLFVRMMRDLGYNFYRQDIYCDNLFAAYFDIKDAPRSGFDLLTAFEVFEHLADPMAEIKKMLGLSENIIFTTVLAPGTTEAFENWWYVSPLTGQHIAFYDKKTLEYIAKAYDKNLYTNGINLHMLTHKKLDGDLVNKVFHPSRPSFLGRVKRVLLGGDRHREQRVSLLQADYSYIENKLMDQP